MTQRIREEAHLAGDDHGGTESKEGRHKDHSQQRVFQLFGVYLPLYVGSVKFDYTATADEKSLQSGDTVLPLSIIEAEFREVKKTAVKLSTDEAKNRAKAELKLLETEQLNGAKIKEKKITFTENEDVIVLIADYVCEENIATEKPLSIIE